jgi:retinol dehydrogenase-12
MDINLQLIPPPFMLSLAVMPKLRETATIYTVDTTLSIIGSMIHVFSPVSQLEIPEEHDILEVLSNSKIANMDGRYQLSKLVLHQCFREFSDDVATSNTGCYQVIVNVVNTGWCKTELGRNQEILLFEKIMEKLLIRTAEQGSRTLVHGVMPGQESNDRYLSKCQIKPLSTFGRSERGNIIEKRLWKEVTRGIKNVSPELVSIIHSFPDTSD